MIRSISVSSLAKQDIAEARRWYESQQSGSGEQFLAAVDGAFERIRDFGDSFELIDPHCRRVPLYRFPFVVYFEIGVDGQALVRAVLHMSRDPSLWSSRRNSE